MAPTWCRCNLVAAAFLSLSIVSAYGRILIILRDTLALSLAFGQGLLFKMPPKGGGSPTFASSRNMCNEVLSGGLLLGDAGDKRPLLKLVPVVRKGSMLCL